jgi:hypothetical protein
MLSGKRAGMYAFAKHKARSHVACGDGETIRTIAQQVVCAKKRKRPNDSVLESRDARSNSPPPKSARFQGYPAFVYPAMALMCIPW